MIYVEDILSFFEKFEKYIDRFKEAFTFLQTAEMAYKLNKCS